MNNKRIEELRSKVEKMNAKANILKVADLENKVFSMNISSATWVEGQYGQQLMIVGTKNGENTRIYLNNKRAKTFENAYDGEGEYAFVFGSKIELKSGHFYIPLDLVEKC